MTLLEEGSFQEETRYNHDFAFNPRFSSSHNDPRMSSQGHAPTASYDNYPSKHPRYDVYQPDPYTSSWHSSNHVENEYRPLSRENNGSSSSSERYPPHQQLRRSY